MEPSQFYPKLEVFLVESSMRITKYFFLVKAAAHIWPSVLCPEAFSGLLPIMTASEADREWYLHLMGFRESTSGFTCTHSTAKQREGRTDGQEASYFSSFFYCAAFTCTCWLCHRETQKSISFSKCKPWRDVNELCTPDPLNANLCCDKWTHWHSVMCC